MAKDKTNHTCVMKSPKNPKGQGLESFWVGDEVEVPGGWPPREHGTSLPFPHTLYPCMHLFHLAVPEFYPFITNQ